MMRNVRRDHCALRRISAEVKKIERRVVASPTIAIAIEAAAVQIPVRNVVTDARFNENVWKKQRRQVDEFLIDEVTSRDIVQAIVVQLRAPPVKKRLRVRTRLDSDKAQIKD